ncbi:2124_t:CDS:1, partial [Acaulospora morrowiae]
KIIGRMYTVYPSDMERFCLRLLLLHTPGAKSFEDLRTVNNYIYASFREAALIRELLDNDDEWSKCLDEAVQWKMPSELRQLFTTILVWGNINNPSLLWNRYKEHLYEDLVCSYSTEVALILTYQDINKKLAQFQKSLEKDFSIFLTTTGELNYMEQIDKDHENNISEK